MFGVRNGPMRKRQGQRMPELFEKFRKHQVLSRVYEQTQQVV